MIMPKIPQRSDTAIDIEAWRNVHFSLQKSNNIKFDSSFRVISDSTGTYVSLAPSNVTATTIAPFTIYQTENDDPANSWRTIAVYDGTINSILPRHSEDYTPSYSTDSDTDNYKIELDEETTYSICVFQYFDPSDWTQKATSIFVVKESDYDASNAPFLGCNGLDQHHAFANVCYYRIGIVTVSDSTSKQLTISQILSSNVVDPVVFPSVWRPVAIADDPITPDAAAWRTAKIVNPGTVSYGTITAIDDGFVMTAGTTVYFYLDWSLNTSTGDVTAVELKTGLAVPSTPSYSSGSAPSHVYYPLAKGIVPSTPDAIHTTMMIGGASLTYTKVGTGWATDGSGNIVVTYGAYWTESGA